MKRDAAAYRGLVTRESALARYLQGAQLCGAYRIERTYLGGAVFIRTEKDGDRICETAPVCAPAETRTIDGSAFFEAKRAANGRSVLIERSVYRLGEETLFWDRYQTPAAFSLILRDPAAGETPGCVDVTQTALYSDEAIFGGSIRCAQAIIEGSDGVGKSSTIAALAADGIVCADRNVDVISANMLFEVPMETRAAAYRAFLRGYGGRVVFMVNHDEAELMRRIGQRETLSAFDRQAAAYDRLYTETYRYMAEREMTENKLFLADCTGLSFAEQTETVRRLIVPEP